MQKKLIALAVAAVTSGAAFAQSNVTIYGVADAAYVATSASGSKSSNLITSGGLSTSRLGFKGTEDLGNGLKAVFQLEYRLNVDGNYTIGGDKVDGNVTVATGGSTSSSGPARQQYVGLSSKLGTLTLGRQETAASRFHNDVTLTATVFDVFGSMQSLTGALISQSVLNRTSNSMVYMSPSFSGFSFEVDHAFTTEESLTAASSAAGSAASATQAAANYKNGPISVGLTWARQNNAAATNDVTDWGLSGSYSMTMAKITAAYVKNSEQTKDADSMWHIGAQIPVSAAGTVNFSYARANLGASQKSVGVKENANGWALVYAHNLSKRTTAYAGYGNVDNSGTAQGASSAKLQSQVNSAGGNSSVLGLGLRHSF